MIEVYLFILAMITWHDLCTYQIPDEWVVAGYAFRLLSSEGLSWQWLLITIAFIMLTPGGLGWGDVKLAMLLYMSGPFRMLRMALSFLFAAVISVGLLLFGLLKKESHLPMAPFLIIVDLFFL